jgi:hypothetical protein
MITKRRQLTSGEGSGGGLLPVIRLYARDGDFLYAGVALLDSETEGALWRITRIELDGNNLVSTAVANNAVWDNRTTEVYS